MKLEKLIEDKATKLFGASDLVINQTALGRGQHQGFEKGANFALTPEVLRQVPMVKDLIWAVKRTCHCKFQACIDTQRRQNNKALLPFQESGGKDG